MLKSFYPVVLFQRWGWGRGKLGRSERSTDIYTLPNVK